VVNNFSFVFKHLINHTVETFPVACDSSVDSGELWLMCRRYYLGLNSANGTSIWHLCYIIGHVYVGIKIL